MRTIFFICTKTSVRPLVAARASSSRPILCPRSREAGSRVWVMFSTVDPTRPTVTQMYSRRNSLASSCMSAAKVAENMKVRRWSLGGMPRPSTTSRICGSKPMIYCHLSPTGIAKVRDAL